MAKAQGGINNLNSDDPVLNRQMFASFANGGEVESTQAENQEAPPLQGEPMKVDTRPEVKGVGEVTKDDIEVVEPTALQQQQIPSVTTTVSTQRQPVLTNQEKMSMFLLPMAAELLNARTPMGANNFQTFLQAAGRGLARIPQQILAVKQLEAKGLDTKVTKRSDIQFTKPFTLDGKTFQPDQRAQLSAAEINAISQVDPSAIVPYDKGTTTKDGLKKVDILQDFTVEGITYKKGEERQVPESVIQQQLKINPNAFGDIPDPDKGGKEKPDFRGFVFVSDFEEAEQEGKKIKKEIPNDNAYPLIMKGDKFFVVKDGENVPYNELQEEGRISNLFTASQYDRARGKVPEAQFFKMEDALEKEKQTIMTFNDMYEVLERGGETFEGKLNALTGRIKIFTGRKNQLDDAEKAKLEQEGSLRRLIGQSRLALFGPGVLTEFEQELAKIALVGNPDFVVLDVAKSLLRKAARTPTSQYDQLFRRVDNQRRKRLSEGEQAPKAFDYSTLPLFFDAELEGNEDEGEQIN
jgi:hypothetical protein